MYASSKRMEGFIQRLKGLSEKDMIWLAHEEATRAERFFYKMCRDQECGEIIDYAQGLKDFIQFMRYGVVTRSIGNLKLKERGFRFRTHRIATKFPMDS